MLIDCGWIGWFVEGGANGNPAVNGGRLVKPVAMSAPASSEAETWKLPRVQNRLAISRAHGDARCPEDSIFQFPVPSSCSRYWPGLALCSRAILPRGSEICSWCTVDFMVSVGTDAPTRAALN